MIFSYPFLNARNRTLLQGLHKNKVFLGLRPEFLETSEHQTLDILCKSKNYVLYTSV